MGRPGPDFPATVARSRAPGKAVPAVRAVAPAALTVASGRGAGVPSGRPVRLVSGGAGALPPAASFPLPAPPVATATAPSLAIDPALEKRCIDTVRTLAMDAVQQAESGHPGTPMALAPLAWLLWTRHLRYDPRDPQWLDRDRFVLSAGHASMLLYSVLHLTGYDL